MLKPTQPTKLDLECLRIFYLASTLFGQARPSNQVGPRWTSPPNADRTVLLDQTGDPDSFGMDNLFWVPFQSPPIPPPLICHWWFELRLDCEISTHINPDQLMLKMCPFLFFYFIIRISLDYKDISLLMI